MRQTVETGQSTNLPVGVTPVCPRGHLTKLGDFFGCHH